ncbi:hypothetical protein A9Q91_00315 [Candidatus Gracilibacteria bacterium 28_42_T64]|nr:hypothetical protein A9Q91_00315 [Candidatus Gracilibacteria bacterium 28_42_T64]
MKKTLVFLFLTFSFTCIIFVFKNYLLLDAQTQIEEQYLDPTVIVEPQENDDMLNTASGETIKEVAGKQDREKELIKTHLLSASKVHFFYLPVSFQKASEQYSGLLGVFLNNSSIQDKIKKLKIEMHEDLLDVRGKMKNKTVKLFGVLLMKEEEFISVSIHEFAHYVDLYFLEKKVLTDISNYYYKISWDSTKVLKPGQKQADFVSGYAMTNKYEDFAESFTYYILHNKDFFIKSEKSSILKEKYIFFGRYIFRNKEFISTDFSAGVDLKSYYRDITKIEINLKKLLQFLKK